VSDDHFLYDILYTTRWPTKEIILFNTSHSLTVPSENVFGQTCSSAQKKCTSHW